MFDVSKINRLVKIYEQSDRRVQVQILVKLSGVPFRNLMSLRDEIPQQMKNQIVHVILQKDGLQSSFVPAELAIFRGEQVDQNALGLKQSSTPGHIPEEFEGTEVAQLLNLSLDSARYFPVPNTLPGVKEKA